MGVAKGPLWFFVNKSIRLGVAVWNFPYLSGHQFYISSERNIRGHLESKVIEVKLRSCSEIVVKNLFQVKRRRAVEVEDTN